MLALIMMLLLRPVTVTEITDDLVTVVDTSENEYQFYGYGFTESENITVVMIGDMIVSTIE